MESHPGLDEGRKVRKKEGVNSGIAFRCTEEDQVALDLRKC